MCRNGRLSGIPSGNPAPASRSVFTSPRSALVLLPPGELIGFPIFHPPRSVGYRIAGRFPYYPASAGCSEQRERSPGRSRRAFGDDQGGDAAATTLPPFWITGPKAQMYPRYVGERPIEVWTFRYQVAPTRARSREAARKRPYLLDLSRHNEKPRLSRPPLAERAGRWRRKPSG